MPAPAFPDEWLAQSLADLVPPEAWIEVREAAGSRTLWEGLVARHHTTDEQILAALARRFHLPVADGVAVDPAVAPHVSEALARRYRVLPLRLTRSTLDIATANPFDLDAEKALAFATGREVRLFLWPPTRIAEKLDELYRPESALDRVLQGLGEAADVVQLAETPAVADQAASAEEAGRRPVVRLADLIIAEAVQSRASDIHLEPAERGVAIRYRIDGVLREAMQLPRAAGGPLVSRLKIMSALDIADRLRPQDGRARVAVNGQPVDLRVSTLPAAHGEKVVIRILDSRATVKSLDTLGLSAAEGDGIRALLRHREGLILVTGPTGCGKTTTLYSMIRQVQTGGVNIVTVEDPVECRIPGIVQVQVQERSGLTFASVLRSILRQDPNVILVGEIRDRETAQIAIQASLTGHLVLSTLHTNDAPGAVTRLVDIGVEPYKIAAALRGVVAQRLMRRLCTACKQPRTEAPPEPVRPWLTPDATLRSAAGCPRCRMTGHRGRFSIVEVLRMAPEVERTIGAGEPRERVAHAARRAGMGSLWESGLAHVLAGDSTIEDLLRVVDIPSGVPPGVAEVGSTIGRRPVVERAPAAGLGERVAPKVLLADSEDEPRRALRERLEADGYIVIEARDGVEALAQVDRAGPDLVLLDLALPGLDGLTLLSRLRSHRATAALPVMVLTANGDEDSEVRVFRLGADDFVTKPLRAGAVSARVAALLNRRWGVP